MIFGCSASPLLELRSQAGLEAAAASHQGLRALGALCRVLHQLLAPQRLCPSGMPSMESSKHFTHLALSPSARPCRNGSAARQNSLRQLQKRQLSGLLTAKIEESSGVKNLLGLGRWFSVDGALPAGTVSTTALAAGALRSWLGLAAGTCPSDDPVTASWSGVRWLLGPGAQLSTAGSS